MPIGRTDVRQDGRQEEEQVVRGLDKRAVHQRGSTVQVDCEALLDIDYQEADDLSSVKTMVRALHLTLVARQSRL